MKLIVVGGVAAGMSAAARRAAWMNRRPSYLNAANRFSFANCALPHRRRDRRPRPVAAADTGKLGRHVESRRADRRGSRCALTAWPGRCATRTGHRQNLHGIVRQTRWRRAAAPPLPGLITRAFACCAISPIWIASRRCWKRGAKAAVVIGGGYIGVEMAETCGNAG